MPFVVLHDSALDRLHGEIPSLPMDYIVWPTAASACVAWPTALWRKSPVYQTSLTKCEIHPFWRYIPAEACSSLFCGQHPLSHHRGIEEPSSRHNADTVESSLVT